jgi:hypothetical protein
VQSRCREAERLEQTVELLDRAAAHQREGAVGFLDQSSEQRTQLRGHRDRARLVLDGDQRAVDVEEQRGVAKGHQGRCRSVCSHIGQ